MKEITGFDAQDIETNKVIAGLAYLFFLIPLLAAPKSKFAKFHVNQAIWIFLVECVSWFVLGYVPFIGGLLAGVVNLATFLLNVYLFYMAYTGKAYELPVVGNIVLFK